MISHRLIRSTKLFFSQTKNKCSFFDIMKKHDLTTLKVSQNNGVFKYEASQDFHRNVPWFQYNHTFPLENFPILGNVIFTNSEIQNLISNFSPEFETHKEKLEEMLEKGRHEFIEFLYLTEKNLGFISNMHSSALADNNGKAALYAGGIRRHHSNEDEIEVIKDGLNLSRAMSFKNYASGIPYGGSKLIVVTEEDEFDYEDNDLLGFIGYAIDRNKSFTGPDMGFELKLCDLLNDNGYSLNIVGGNETPMGKTGLPTSFGVMLAMESACKIVYGDKYLSDKVIAVQGLGTCGYKLCKHILHYHGVNNKLYVTDINEDTLNNAVNKLRGSYEGANIEIVDPNEIYEVDCDIFSPNSIGGVITKENIPELKCRIIMGAANNQLKSVSMEEEIELAKMLQDYNILYQIDWFHNVGGVICGAEAWENRDESSWVRVKEKIFKSCVHNTLENIITAKEKGITPTENAYLQAEESIYRS